MRDGGRVDGHLLIGHTHWDHIQGLPFFAPLFQPGNVWHVYGPRGLDTSIDKTLAGQMQYTYFPVQLLDFGATIEYHDLVEGQFEIDDVIVTTRYLHHPALTSGYRDRGRRRRRRVLVGPRADGRRRARSRRAGGREPRGGTARRVPPRRRPRDPRRAVPRRRSTPRRWVGVTARSSTWSTSRRRPTCGGSRCIHHDPTRTDDASGRTRRARTSASAREVGYAGEVFAAAEGTSRSRSSPRTTEEGDSRRSTPRTARRRSTSCRGRCSSRLRIATPTPRCTTAAASRASTRSSAPTSTRSCTCARTEQPPIVVLEAAPGRSLDELADDARRDRRELPRGRDRRVRHHDHAAAERDPSRDHRLARVAGVAVAPPHEAAGLAPAARVPVAEPRRCRPTSPSVWPRCGTSGSSTPIPEDRFDRYTEVACSTFDVPDRAGDVRRRRSPVVQVARRARRRPRRRATSRCARTPSSATTCS